jgi:DNA-binding NtrC family response regulator
MAIALVVDDDPMILHRFKRELEGSDVRLITAQSAKEGLLAVREHQPDVTVLDVMLPDLSGLETYRQIRDLDPQLPVIFITTSSESSTAIEAMSLGAYDYLLKPLDSSKLRALLLRAIEIRRLMQTPVELVEQGQPDGADTDALIGRCAAMQAARARSWWPAPSTSTATASTRPSWRSTAPRFPNRCWKANCSGTRKGPLPARNGGGSASSSNAPAAQSSWTRSAT